MRRAAGVLYVSAGRVLMVGASYKRHWDIPGGVVEQGETPREAAVREVKEELGFTAELGRLLVVDVVRASSDDPLIAYIFAGRTGRNPLDTSLIRVDGVEVLEWAWCNPTVRFDRTSTAPIFRRRLARAVDAHVLGHCYALEDGRDM